MSRNAAAMRHEAHGGRGYFIRIIIFHYTPFLMVKSCGNPSDNKTCNFFIHIPLWLNNIHKWFVIVSLGNLDIDSIDGFPSSLSVDRINMNFEDLSQNVTMFTIQAVSASNKHPYRGPARRHCGRRTEIVAGWLKLLDVDAAGAPRNLHHQTVSLAQIRLREET